MTLEPASARSDEGFTLVELLVTIMLLGVITTAVMTVVITVQRTQLFQVDTSVSMDETRQALDRMRTEVRASRRVLTTSGADRLDVWVDRDQDGIPDAPELVTYAIAPVAGSNAVLQRWTGGAPTPVVVGRQLVAASSSFTYDNGTPDFETRVVTMTLTAEGPQNSRAEAMTVSAEVRLRNVAVSA